MIKKEFFPWQLNVKDKFKSSQPEEIKSNLVANAPPCAILMANIQGDFNFSSIIRTANSFGIVDFYYYGRRRFDRRGACGTYHYANLNHLSSFDEIKSLKEKYSFVGFENNVEKTVPIQNFSWKPNSLICLGEEGSGIEKDLFEILDDIVEIPSFGSVRSLNVGAAASIAMYDYMLKMRL